MKHRLFANRRKFVILVLTAVLLCSALAGCGSGRGDSGAEKGNPAYFAILEKQNISSPAAKSGDYQIAAFAKELEPGIVQLEEYKYKGDVVSSITRREFYDVNAMTEERLEGIQSNIRYFVDEVNRHPNFYATEGMDHDSYRYVVTLSGMDSPNLFEKTRREGILFMLRDEDDHISMQTMRDILMAEGYTER